MPSNKDFTMSILVGGVELPEYSKDGTCFVESNLFTPVSYNVHLEEEVQGETEAQSWPVTPYQIRVAAKSNTPYSYYKIYVDGQKASQVAVHPGKQCISEGFYDGSQITEFLFSLPRFPKNEKDRIEKGKASRIGVLEVECWNSKVTGYKRPVTHDMEYSQANKKDSSNVTQGQYMMATTKMGKSLRTTQKSLVEDWTLFNVRSKLSVKYVMGHSLIDMGFKLKPIRIPIHRIPASVVHQPTSVAKRKKPGPLSKKFPVPSSSIPDPVASEVIEIDSDDSDEEVMVGDVVSSKKQKLEDAIDVDESMTSEAEGTSGEIDIKTEAKEDGDEEDAAKETESKDDDSKSDNNEEEMETEGSKDDNEEKEAEDGGDGKERDKEKEAAKSGDNSEAEGGDGVDADGKENGEEKGESEGKGDADSEKGEDGGNSDDKPADSVNSSNKGETEAGGSGDAPGESVDSNDGEAEAGESGDAPGESEDSSKEGEAGVNASEEKPAESVGRSKEGNGEPGESGETPDVPEESMSTSEVKGDEENTKEDDVEKCEDKQKDEEGDNSREGQENGDDSNGQNDSAENE
ncbi:dentin sialophosphoprotein-like, partial [Haliotis rubra]|uniref:dentin sialophosphoprotein-like n=1 Tax=Haliotis rubra TaxID=36100 RepID=UPI001EE5EF39